MPFTNIIGSTPLIVVNELSETIQYYTDKMGFRLDWTWPSNTEIKNAGLSLGMNNEEKDHDENSHIHVHLAETDKPIIPSGWLIIHVEKIDELWNYYKDKQVIISREINDYAWGHREFEIEDPFGNKFRFSEELEE